jgi:carotenoid cleavage dioxygenase-like enzyme
MPLDSFTTKLWKYWSDQEEEVMDLELTSSTSFKLPSWLDGEFLVAGPSKFGMGDKMFDHVLDGFGRYNRFKIDNNTIKFSTKMLDSKWYKGAKEENDILPGFTFKETNPPRWLSSVPFANFYYSTKYFDNNWVMPSRMPDGKTYMGMTDMPLMLEMDIETLEQKGFVEWQDSLECTMGTTHVKNLPNGDLVGVCSEITTRG